MLTSVKSFFPAQSRRKITPAGGKVLAQCARVEVSEALSHERGHVVSS